MNSLDADIKPEGCCMAFTPQSCPTKGGEVLFISYSDDFPLPNTAEFFLVFEGSNQRHVTTAIQTNPYTLQAVVPGHDSPEKVSLTVYCHKDGTVGLLSTHWFTYHLETEQILADILAHHASNSQFLDHCISLCTVTNVVSNEFRDTLDSRITKAFEQLQLSPKWTLLEDDGQSNGMDKGFETLLHLSAHLGFSQLGTLLLNKPGARDALEMQDKNGMSPLDIANDKGLTKLVDAFSRGPGRNNENNLPSDKPRATKTNIGTTTISSFKKQSQNSIEKDIDMLKEMHNLVKDELNRKTPVFKHCWPVVKPSSRPTDKSSTADYSDHILKREDVRLKTPGSNRQLLEQNLKRLRDINEEIQRLRVSSQRNSRESTRGPADKRQIRRLSCPSFRGQDILQAHLLIGAAPPSEKPLSPGNDKPTSESTDNHGNHLTAKESMDVRRRSWGDQSDEPRPEFQRRVSSSLDDLSSSEPGKKTKDPARSRTQVIVLPKHLTKEEKSNKLADIIDSIKSEEKQGVRIDPKSNLTAPNRNAPNSVSMQGKSYSYTCLATLPLDDGTDSAPSGDTSAGDQSSTTEKPGQSKEEMSWFDFLSNDPDDSPEDSEEPTEKDKPEKGIRRLSMLFGNKTARHSKRELPKAGHVKTRERTSMRKEKGQSMINLSVRDAEFKDRTDNKDSTNTKTTAIGRRASGLSHRSSKLGEGATLPNPGMLTRNSGNKLSASHSFKSISPLPSRKSLNPSQDEGDDKSISGISLEGSGDEDMDDDGVFSREGMDSDLELKEEADAWSLTVDKKTLKKMTAKDIKRQDVIHELIQTEEHYVRTLKIMFKIFYSGMTKDLHLPKETVNSIFPKVEELLEIHTNFLNNMKAKETSEGIVERIGDVLEDQFSGSSGKRMDHAYGDFCSHHIEAVDLYKKLCKNDKKFADFVKKCSVNKICRRLSIPECITLVTQRLTKYPLLFEAIIKTTKEIKSDYSALKKATTLVKGVLHSVDNTIKKYEKVKTLQDIKMRMDLKVTITYKAGKKVKNLDFASNSSVLLHDGILLWKTARGKFVESLVLVLEDMLVFLQEKDQKYSLLSLDQKAPVIRLNNLFVREVATDLKAIFLVSTDKEGPEMYEMVCSTPKEKRLWIKTIKEAITSAPKDKGTGELITTVEGEKRRHLLRRAEALIEQVQSVEEEQQGKFLPEMQELINQLETEEGTLKGSTKEEVAKTRESLFQIMSKVQAATIVDETHDQFLEDSVKRAETFSGFDNKQKLGGMDQSVTRAWSMKTERTAKSYNRQIPEATESSPDLGSPSTRHKRRGSGGSGWRKGKDDPADLKGDHGSQTSTPDPQQMESEDRNGCVVENTDAKPPQDVIYF